MALLDDCRVNKSVSIPYLRPFGFQRDLLCEMQPNVNKKMSSRTTNARSSLETAFTSWGSSERRKRLLSLAMIQESPKTCACKCKNCCLSARTRG